MKHRSVRAAAWSFSLAFAVLSAPLQAAQFANRSFESDTLDGWAHIGDVSVQSADVLGIPVTHGQRAALLTTSLSGIKEPKYGADYGTGSLNALQWLGLPERFLDDDGQFVQEYRDYLDWAQLGNRWVTEIGGHSLIRQSVQLRANDVVSFDWNRVGDRIDGAFALLYPNDGPFYHGTYAKLWAPFVLANTMDPWTCWTGRPDDQECLYQTGWQHFAQAVPVAGLYTLAIGTFDREDDGWLTALWLDNFKVSRVPEPSSLALIGLGLAGLAFTRRRKQ